MAEPNSKVSIETLDRITRFIEDYDLDRMRRNLRKVFFDYLRQQQAGLTIEFGNVLNDVENLIELLEDIEQNNKP